MKILNLINDIKFVQFAQRTLFDTGSVSNIWCSFVLENVETLLFIRDESELNELLSDIDVLILHSLNNFELNLLNKIEFKGLIVWKGYGKDYYRYIYLNPLRLFDAKTKYLYLKFNQKSGIRFFLSLLKQKLFIDRSIKNLRRIDLFIPVLENENLLMKKSVLNFLDCYNKHWNYVPFLEKNTYYGRKNNIIVGNSNTYSNNHLEVLDLLRKLKVRDRYIFVPLSYGSAGINYRNEIIRIGKAYFGDNFVPILDFLPSEEYNRIIYSCEFMIMNHYRQQALGNILEGLNSKVTIYLNEKNPIYDYLTINGILIGNINDLEKNKFLKLSDSNKEINREKVVSMHSDVELNRRTEDLYTDLQILLQNRLV